MRAHPVLWGTGRRKARSTRPPAYCLRFCLEDVSRPSIERDVQGSQEILSERRHRLQIA